MVNIVQLSAIILVGVSVGVADALLKKIILQGNFSSAFKNPLMLLVFLLYFAQIVFFLYIFSHHWKLGLVGNLQMIFYSLTVVLAGFFFFSEGITFVQAIGIGFALIGILLLNI